MKQVLVDLNKGDVKVEDVPPPVLKGKGVIVDNHYSVISGGTENSLIQLASSSYLGKARKKPDLFMKVVEMAKKQGPITAYKAVKGRLDKPEPLGYSCAGVVTRTSKDSAFSKGDRVACGGAGYANHADRVFVPDNLCVRIPDEVSTRDAAFTTIGAIAMQGVRNAETSIGEDVAVIGLGLIGQITVQILKASGCRVFGMDLDKKRIDLAMKKGMDDGILASSSSLQQASGTFTRGRGFDSVIITAATDSNGPLVQAGNIARKKGRVVLVGVVGMEIPRDIYYPKELEFVISCSYGPGRYDPEYEELGNDYPVGYVRWTENRNMESFLDLLARGRMDLEGIATHVFGIDDAPKAYQLVTEKVAESHIGLVLSYGKEKTDTSRIELKKAPKKKPTGEIGIGWVGAGSFATTTLLPAVKNLKGARLVGLSAGSGISTRSAAENYGFEYCTSDYNDLIADDRIDALVVTTRNSLHAKIASAAVEKGKHVFVEKPLAVSKKELNALIKLKEKHPETIVQVGFNRRFAPMTKTMKGHLGRSKGPMIIHYRVNGGKLPSTYWVYEEREGGSRFVSEMCHFIDYCRFLTDSPIAGSHLFKLSSRGMDRKEEMENVVLSLNFENGSIASIIYDTIGDSSLSKEYVEVQCGGSTLKLFDFRELHVIKGGKASKTRDHLRTEKGHKEEMEAFIENIRKGHDPFEEYIDTTRITLEG